MKRIISAFAGLVLLSCLAAPAAADPIQIVSGTFVVNGFDFNRATFALVGDDGSIINGRWPFGRSQAGSACHTCPGGTTIGPAARFDFGVPFFAEEVLPGGTVVLGGKSSSLFFGGSLDFTGPTMALPQRVVESWLPAPVLLMLPFEMTAVLNGFELLGFRDAQLRFSRELRGRGWATMQFAEDGPIGKPARFDFIRTTFEFQALPTPEPATLLLVGSGLAAAWASRPKRRR